MRPCLCQIPARLLQNNCQMNGVAITNIEIQYLLSKNKICQETLKIDKSVGWGIILYESFRFETFLREVLLKSEMKALILKRKQGLRQDSEAATINELTDQIKTNLLLADCLAS